MKHVWVVYGGRSGEHEISLRSAYSVAKHLNRDQYVVSGLGIAKDGRWMFSTPEELATLCGQDSGVLAIPTAAEREVIPILKPQGNGRFAIQSAKSGALKHSDVIFPVMHGPLCEDGAIQGLFELVDAAFVGSGVLGSAVSMDKEVSKRLARDAGIPILPYFLLTRHLSENQVSKQVLAAAIERCEKDFGFPVFVKPSRMGSSVGVHKVKKASDFEAALNDAFQYDTKVLVEKAIDAREIEFSVLKRSSSLKPDVSLAGEIVPKHEFYSYEAKYIDPDGAQFYIPARLSPEELKAAQLIAEQTFIALEIQGLARVDLLQDKSNGKLYLNEPNTLPGFTSISMYPKLWEASGLSYPALLTELVEEAIGRFQLNQSLKRSYTKV